MARKAWAPIVIPHRLSGEVLDVLLPMQVTLAKLDLRERPLPPIYELAQRGRIRYRADNLGVKEEWLTPRWILERGVADCKSLMAMRVAQLHLSGEDPYAEPRRIQQGDIFHTYVERGDGTPEDPSAILGMPLPNFFPWPRR